MGEVWACCHVDDGREGALKVLRSGMGADALARFKREMLALDKLRHHAIVGLLDHDLNHAFLPWLVMEKIEGTSLEPVIDRGPMPVEACLRPFSALADGLAQAHAYGVHHRDVKSNNVILRPDGSMVLVDFGAAIEDDSSQVTRAGMLLGTSRYLPPEVLCGEDRDNVLADIYALGMLVNECLTGMHAFSSSEGKPLPFRTLLRDKMAIRQLDPGPGFTDEVRRVVRMCTVSDPDERLNRMDDLADMLEVASGSGGRTPMLSLRRSERLQGLKGEPTPEAPDRVTPRVPPEASKASSEATVRLSRSDRPGVPTEQLELPPLPDPSPSPNPSPSPKRGVPDGLVIGFGLLLTVALAGTGASFTVLAMLLVLGR